MFERDILENEIEEAVKNGEIIETYLDDKPYPSFLTLLNNKKPLLSFPRSSWECIHHSYLN